MKRLLQELKKGRTFSQYGFAYDNNCFYRWDDTFEIINAKSVMALIRKGLIGKAKIVAAI